MKKHNPDDCPFLHIKNCKGCGRCCGCYTKGNRIKPTISPELAIKALEKELVKAKSRVVSRFDEDEIPIFRQGYPKHELEDFVTAEQCTWMVKELKQLREKVWKLLTSGINSKKKGKNSGRKAR